MDGGRQQITLTALVIPVKRSATPRAAGGVLAGLVKARAVKAERHQAPAAPEATVQYERRNKGRTPEARARQSQRTREALARRRIPAVAKRAGRWGGSGMNIVDGHGRTLTFREHHLEVSLASRTEGCLCGGFIEVADRHDALEVAEQVALHRATARHRAWWEGLGAGD